MEITPEKLNQSIINSFKVLGKDKVMELIKLCEFK